MDMRVKLKTGPVLGRHSRRSLALLASIIGRKHNVQVVFRNGWGASTDGKTIYLPLLSHDATEDDAELLVGLMDHEAMHCRFTDFEVHKQPWAKKAFAEHPMVFPLHNTFEDVWGEREQAKVYPGCFRNIKRSVEVMIDKSLYGGPSGKVPVELALRNFILQALLGRLYDMPILVQFGAAYRAILEKHVGAVLVERIWDKALEVDQVVSTDQSVKLAISMFELIKDELENEEASAKPKPKRVKALRDLVTNAPEDVDIAGLLADALKSSGGIVQLGSNSPVPLDVTVKPRDSLTRLVSELNEHVRPIAVKLGSKLEVLLESRVQSNSSYGARGRRLAARRVPRIALGERNLFRHLEDEEGLDTYVHILLDLSFSMYNPSTQPEPQVVAKAAVLSMGDVMDKFAIPFGVSIYGCDYTDVKLAGDGWRKVRPYVDVGSMGGTRSVDALSRVIPLAASQSQNRRLVLLVTDGNTDGGNSLMVPVLNELTAAGLEFAAVQIGRAGNDLEAKLTEAGYATERAEGLDDVPQAIFNAIRNAV